MFILHQQWIGIAEGQIIYMSVENMELIGANIEKNIKKTK